MAKVAQVPGVGSSVGHCQANFKAYGKLQTSSVSTLQFRGGLPLN